MNRRGIRPRFKLALGWPGKTAAVRRVLPFRRPWKVIVILTLVDIAFIVPAVITLKQAGSEWGQFDSLFELVTAIFLSAWVLGWSVGPLIMTAVLLMLMFGREVLVARPGQVELYFGLPGVAVGAVYDAASMRNFRAIVPAEKSGTSWRGPHAAFDYGANDVAFGSALGSAEVSALKAQLEMASGQTFRRGVAPASELAQEWDEGKVEQELTAADPSPETAGPVTLTSFSTLVLVVANVIPLAGTVLLGWRLSDVMVLYWAESAIIGFWNICKMAVIGRWLAIFSGLFFIAHFGAFMAVHFLFIYGLFVEGLQHVPAGSDDLADVARLFYDLWPALAALFVSHGLSFFSNFLGRQEYRGRELGKQMHEPYSRIVFMHLVLILGGGLSLALGDATPVLIIVILLKIVVDIRSHLRQHR